MVLLNIFKKYGIIEIDRRKIRSYWWSGEGNRNFGDLLTPYLIYKISGKNAFLCSRKCLKDYYVITGSILGSTNSNAVVWGAGILRLNQKIKKPKRILAVRGPLTRERFLYLGYACPEVYGDPALLLPRFYKPKVKKKYILGIIPHYVDYSRIKKLLNPEEVLVINLLDPVEKVIDNILSCWQTISSSLHGLITSQAYNIPSVWAEFSNKVVGDGTKFKDYFLSVGIEPYEPYNFLEEIPSTKELIKIASYRKDKIKLDLNKLMRACPLI